MFNDKKQHQSNYQQDVPPAGLPQYAAAAATSFACRTPPAGSRPTLLGAEELKWLSRQ